MIFRCLGPQGTVFAFGTKDATGNYQLGMVQFTHINGGNADLGDVQGWNNSSTPRVITDINGDGRADIVAFGAAGVEVHWARTRGRMAGSRSGNCILHFLILVSTRGGLTP